ncbi:hypothetical protein LTR95_003521 [Oleoguttula sp. CCFEE 5521]
MPSSTSKTNYEPPQWFWDSRKKGPSAAGTFLFVALRAIDLPFQYWLLSSGAGSRSLATIGLSSPSASAPLPTTGVLGQISSATGLSPYHALIMVLVTGSAAKQIYWKLEICDTVMPPGFSVGVAAYNTILNSLNTLFSLSSLSQDPSALLSQPLSLSSVPPTLAVGVPLYAVGLFWEWYSEIQRKAFKVDPKNKGKPYSDGLFGLARNINYGGYTLWRTGYSLISAGWAWGAVQSAFLAGDFTQRGIPSLDAYCEKRYGAQWDEVRRKVPYKLIPYIY